MKSIVCLSVSCLVVVSAWSSEPGQPLAVEDWNVVDPTVDISLWAPHDADCPEAALDRVPEGTPSHCGVGGLYEAPWWSSQLNPTGNLVDAAGSIWVLRQQLLRDASGEPLMCLDAERWKIEILRCSAASTCVPVALLADRCSESPPGLSSWTDRARVVGLWLDSTNGYLYVRYKSFRTAGGAGATSPDAEEQYGVSWEIVRLHGLTTLFEVFQTYPPLPTQLGFRVPYMPEGLPAADHFDTYYGDLATVGDWSQAQPLRCGYPTSPPSAGDYLTVEDPLPDPPVGHGRYYVTAVNYMGQRRYGRKSNGGFLSGRDPAVLPSCDIAR